MARRQRPRRGPSSPAGGSDAARFRADPARRDRPSPEGGSSVGRVPADPARRDRPSRAGAGAGSRRFRADPARRAAYDVLRAVADRDAYANLLLPALLGERGLTGRDAAFATELTYGTLRGLGTYDAILAACSDRDQVDPPVRDVLRLGAHQLLATRVGSHAAVATSVDLARDVCGPRPSGFVNAVLRRVATRDLEAWLAIVAPDRAQDPSGYLAVRHSYPRWIVDAFQGALGTAGAELEDALAAGNVRPDVVLAVPPGLPAAPEPEHAAGSTAPPGPAEPGHAAGSTAPTRWSPYGLRLAGGDPAPLVASGQAAVQDEASQLAALALTRVDLTRVDLISADLISADLISADPAAAHLAVAANEDRLWLDLCAGPGGKARLLAGLAAARGARLLASDVRPHRARKVLHALRRAWPAPDSADLRGHASAVVVADGLRVPWPPGTFDRVLADVPCSGLGSLRRRPEARWRKTPADVQALARLQCGLLNAALDSVRPGGVVAYVTCSPHVAETREVVLAVADTRDDVTILDAPAVLAEVPALRAPAPVTSQSPKTPHDPKTSQGPKAPGTPEPLGTPETPETPEIPEATQGPADPAPDPRQALFAQFWPHRHGTDAIFLALLRRG